jgi:hypothetical protein
MTLLVMAAMHGGHFKMAARIKVAASFSVGVEALWLSISR